MTGPDLAVDAPVTARSRDAVLATLRTFRGAVPAAAVARELGLHTNTARGHLELLVRTGLAQRSAEKRAIRGRPRILYAASDVVGPARSASADPFRTLATALAIELANVSAVSQDAADAAGRIWATSLSRSGRLTTSQSREDAIAQVCGLFGDLGFDVDTEPLGDRLYLRQCPYAEQIAAFPGICDLHLGLLRAAFVETGQHVTVPEMSINARPGLCVAQLAPADPAPLEALPQPTPTMNAEEPA